MTAATSTTPVDDVTAADLAVADLAEPVELRPPIVDRLIRTTRELTATPRRAALLTAWCFCAIAAVVALVPSTVAVRTSLGAARARCGLDAFVYGYPDPAVRVGCRHAEAGHLALFVPAVMVVLAGVAAATWLGLRRSGRAGRLLASPVRLALAATAGCAALVGLAALRPAVAELSGGGAVTTARCGADTYFFGYPDRAVDTACHHAYAPHARALLVAAVVVALVAAALALLGWRPRSGASWAGLAAAGAAIVAACLLAPVTVRVTGEAIPATARCGLDTVLAGHPDHAVERACRSRTGGRSLIGLAALATAASAGAFAATRRRSATGVAEVTA